MKHCATCQLIFADHTQLCPHDGTALRLVEDIQPGMIVRGKYRILERIGAGGMAVVYRARHELLNEERAIKMVLPKYASDRDFLKRFRHEASVARKLRHENAVWVEDLDETEDGRPFIAMELLCGCDLGELIRKEGPFPVERTLALASQIASALGAAHQLGIVHRDMKPDNVFITLGKRGQEVAKVLDFGIAKAMETHAEGAGYTLTKTGMIMGTPQYISPEQAMGKAGGKLDGRADIYSLGIVIYEMLTGRLPFESDTPMGMVLHHINTKPKPPHELMPALRIPQPVSLLLMKALEKDPAKRFQTADELAQALQNPSVWATTVVLGSASPAAPIEAATVAAWPVPAAQAVARLPEMASREDSSPPVSGSRVRSRASIQAGTGKGRFRIWMAVAPLALIAAIATGLAEGLKVGVIEMAVAALALIAAIGVALFFALRNSPARIEPQTSADKGGTAGATKTQRQPVTEAGVSPPPGSDPRVRPGASIQAGAGKGRFRIWMAVAALGLIAGIGVALFYARQNSPARTEPQTPADKAATAGGGTKVNPKDGLTYVWIPPGTFQMGCSPGDSECSKDDSPAHTVTITKGFWMGHTEVTQAAYQRVVGTNPSSFHGDWLPVESVSWDDANAYCSAVGMRLPTEAEWEYAARAGSTASRYGEIDAIAWYDKNSGNQAHEVGQKEPNAWKLYDMLGNVWEWTNDWYDESYYGQSPSQDPRGPSSGQYRALRGGSWVYDAWVIRVSGRFGIGPGVRFYYSGFGFRCAGE